MDLRIYRNTEDKQHDLRADARANGAVLGVNMFTLREVAHRLAPSLEEASPSERLVLAERALGGLRAPDIAGIVGYAADALSDLKGARIESADLRRAGQDFLADLLGAYDDLLEGLGLVDPNDLFTQAADHVDAAWVGRFGRIILYALYDLNNAEFDLVSRLLQRVPDGGTVVMFNSTTNIRPTQFAERTWRRFIFEDELAERTVPDFCRRPQEDRPLLERLFEYEPADPLEPDPGLRVIEAAGRYDEIEYIGRRIRRLLDGGMAAEDILVVVRHLEDYGEMIEDVFSRYQIPHVFPTGLPLLRIPFIKYWLHVLDLVTGARSRLEFARALSSAYYEPRLSPDADVSGVLSDLGYVDRSRIEASALAARKSIPLGQEFLRFEALLDSLEGSEETVRGFLDRLKAPDSLTSRDAEAWDSLVEALAGVDRIVGCVSFEDFRGIASATAGLRRVGRLVKSRVTPGAGRVAIAGPHVLGYRNFSALFAPGLGDGRFPAPGWLNPLLDDATVKSINEVLRPRRLMSGRDRNRREPLYLFMVLDSAPLVTLTYPRMNLAGDPLYPSIYIREIDRHYRTSVIERLLSGPAPLDHAGRLRALADGWRRGNQDADRGRELLGDDIMRRVVAEGKGVHRANVGVGEVPVGVAWHPSQIAALERCPFVFFARHPLGLESQDEPGLDIPIREIGILAHQILRDFHSTPVPVSIDAARNRMRRVVHQNLADVDIDRQGPTTLFDPATWPIRREQLVRALDAYLEFAVEDARSGYETVVEFLESPFPAVAVSDFKLAGRPDHVSVHRSGEQVDGIRVDDFKYSAGGDYLNKGPGRNQLDIYVFLAREVFGQRGGAASGDTVLEGRYLLLRTPEAPSVATAYTEEGLRTTMSEIDRQLQTVRAGRFQPAPDDPQSCPSCDFRRLCRLYVN